MAPRQGRDGAPVRRAGPLIERTDGAATGGPARPCGRLLGAGRTLVVPRSPLRERHPVLEFFYTGLLVAVFLFITWFSFYVVYKLYQGQR